MNFFAKNTSIYLLGIVILLLGVIGLQSYLLFQKPDSLNNKKDIIQLDEKDLISPGPAIQEWDPFEDFVRIQKRMNQFFEKGFPGFDSSLPNLKSFSFGGPISQNMALEDMGDQYVITMELPGLDHTNVDVSVEGQSLRISGNMDRKEETKKDQAFFQSHQSQHFERYLTLPGAVKPETLRVEYENTKLKISVEKNTS